jgi:hypothetical protein
MQKLFTTAAIGIITLFLVPAFGSAQVKETTPTAKSPVAFRIEVGKLVCKDGFGTASILFITEPQKGGYFEIVGDTINRNEMTLDRRMALKSGTYTWKGVANEGYREVPPSIGQFIVPACTASSSPAVSPLPISKKEPSIIAEETKKPLDNIEKNASIATTTASSSDATESNETKTNQSGTSKAIIAILVIFGLTIGVFGLKNSGKKEGE